MSRTIALRAEKEPPNMRWPFKNHWYVDHYALAGIQSRLDLIVERIGRIEEKQGEILEIHSHMWRVVKIDASSVTIGCACCKWKIVASREVV